jgi:hypothetical protein
MGDQRDRFFAALLACSSDHPQTCLTLTAIHPDGKHATPSRHLRLHDTAALHNALARLDSANRQGWGAYFAVGLRRPGLSRWQRGGAADVLALPALFVDIDDRSPDALSRLRGFSLTPSCIVHSGGGFHAYWWLDTPTTDLETARRILQRLAAELHGDPMSVAQSLRIVGTVNTKPARNKAQCRMVSLSERRYTLNDFSAYQPAVPASRRIAQRQVHPHGSTTFPHPDLIAQVTAALLAYGCKPRGDWLNGPCPNAGRHKHGDRHPSFGFNTRSGYGFCHVCGTLLLRDLCPALGIQSCSQPRKEVMPSK